MNPIATAAGIFFAQEIGKRLPRALNTEASLHKAMAQLAPDGKSVLFAAFPVNPDNDGRTGKKLQWKPLQGGEAKTVPLKEPMDEFRCSNGSTRRCILRKTEGRSWFKFFALDPVSGEGKELARTAWQEPIDFSDFRHYVVGGRASVVCDDQHQPWWTHDLCDAGRKSPAAGRFA